MMLIQLLGIMIIICLGWPTGKIISKNCKEELKPGKKFFYALCIVMIIGMIAGLILLRGDEMILAESTMDFIFLLGLASIHEANKRKK
jgi:hypothetical protein